MWEEMRPARTTQAALNQRARHSRSQLGACVRACIARACGARTNGATQQLSQQPSQQQMKLQDRAAPHSPLGTLLPPILLSWDWWSKQSSSTLCIASTFWLRVSWSHFARAVMTELNSSWQGGMPLGFFLDAMRSSRRVIVRDSAGRASITGVAWRARGRVGTEGWVGERMRDNGLEDAENAVGRLVMGAEARLG